MFPLTLLLLFSKFVSGGHSEEYNNVMIVGGFDSGYLSNVEIVALNNSTPTCQNPTDYPVSSEGMVGIAFGKMTLLCGGLPYTSDCYAYDFVNEFWIPHISMKTARGFASAVMLNDSHWWITGGFDGSLNYETTELYDIETDSFSYFVNLPVATAYHNMLKVDESHFFFCCGKYMSGKSYILDLESHVWAETPQSQFNHYEGFAGM